MRAKFLHMADCHLGYRQYNSRDRFNDFTRAFLDIVRTAVAENVDFVVLAGDLFQKRSIDALTLNAAMVGLERLRRAGIPCIAVEGNHELAYYNDAVGWLRFLAERELLVLLNPLYEDGRLHLRPYERRQGAYIEPAPGLRVYGMRYYGSSTGRVLQDVAEALGARAHDGIEYTILIAHTGVEGVLAGDAGGLSHRELAPLRPHVDYLALGHVHKPFHFDDWIYNPGSPETCALTEASWPERGYYIVEVDTQRPRQDGAPPHTVTLHANPRRPFIRLNVRTDHSPSPAALLQHCHEYMARKQRDLVPRLDGAAAPVVELRLSGVLPFDRSALHLQEFETLVQEHFRPLLGFVRNVTQPAEFAVTADRQLTRREMEREIVTDLLERDSRFRSRSGEWTDLVLEIKRMAVTRAAPEAILEELAGGLERLGTSAAADPT